MRASSCLSTIQSRSWAVSALEPRLNWRASIENMTSKAECAFNARSSPSIFRRRMQVWRAPTRALRARPIPCPGLIPVDHAARAPSRGGAWGRVHAKIRHKHRRNCERTWQGRPIGRRPCRSSCFRHPRSIVKFSAAASIRSSDALLRPCCGRRLTASTGRVCFALLLDSTLVATLRLWLQQCGSVSSNSNTGPQAATDSPGLARRSGKFATRHKAQQSPVTSVYEIMASSF